MNVSAVSPFAPSAIKNERERGTASCVSSHVDDLGGRVTPWACLFG